MKYLYLNKTNCIFFNCKNKTSTYDFHQNITEIPLNNSNIVYPFPSKRQYKPQWEEEIIIDEEEDNPWNKLLNQKRYREIGEKIYIDDKKDDDLLLKNLYLKFMELIKVTYRMEEEELLPCFGKFKEFYYNNFGKNNLFPISQIYIFVFKLANYINNGEIDLSKDLGLIYYKDNMFYFLSIQEKKYLSEEDFIKKFKYYCWVTGKFGNNYSLEKFNY